jgi:PKD repeat protein
MRTFWTAVLILFLFTTVASADGIKQVDQPKGIPSFLGYVPDRFIVVTNLEIDPGNIQKVQATGVPHIGEAEFDRISDRFAVTRIQKQFHGAAQRAGAVELAKYHKITISAGDLESAMDAYRKHPRVERVEPIGIHSMYATPSDFYYSYQWHLNQASDHDIDAPEAWDIEVGQDNTIVAILDSGTRYYHPDLGGVNASPSTPEASRGNMWINTAELNGAFNVDDDGNGYVDDWIGYDFIESTSNCWPGEDCGVQDPDPRDFNGHGTHTSGIFGMITNDGYGMCGVAGGWLNGSQQEYGNGVKIMALRMGYSYNYLGQEYGVVLMDAAAEAFYYAANNGAKIASCSWGSSNSGGISTAATYFLNSGGIICVAAGNGGTEESPDYLNGRGDCISVAATDENDDGASFTTYGTWVDISAPGNNIYSTFHDHTDPETNYWAAMGGTSMATPMVAGVCALIWSQNPAWTASQVETQLYASADNIDAYLSSRYIGKMGAGRINAYNAVVGGCDLTADFSADQTTGCAALTVNFTDLSTGSGIDGWSWDFGDGVGTSSAQNPSYTYNNAGTYTVTLTVSSSSQGCDATEIKTDYITVNATPVADFVGSPLTGTEPLTVDFTDLSTDATSWDWDFGDGVGTSTQQNPSYTYNNAGTYTVTLTATNACGSDVEQKVDYITVDPCVAPVADFSGTPTTGEAPLDVTFTDLSTGNPTSWDWDFGDGSPHSSLQNPAHTYSAAGDYTVTLTATNACGSDDEIKVDYIHVDPATAAKAYAQSDIPVAGTVTGTYVLTHNSDNSREQIQERESGGKPSNRYTYLEHKWDFSIASSTTITFFVEGYRNDNPDGDNFVFAYSTDNVNYTDLLTVNSATEQVYSASIPNTVSGTVYIRVTDTDQTPGHRSGDIVYIDEMYIEYSSEPCTETTPVADFTGSPTSGDAPLTVNFTDLSANNPDTWLWDFGDDGSSTLQNPTYEYTAPGTYTVTLTASNCAGSDIATKTDYITVTASSAYVYVYDMVVGRKVAGPNNSGTCTISIYNSLGQPTEGATVYATATGPVGGNFDGVTGADGTVRFETGKIKNPSGEWCFEVTNVTHASYAYNSAANIVTKACESGPVYKRSDPTMVTVATETGLAQNSPNPFNAGTNITFTLEQSGTVELTVYNVLGQAIRNLADGFYSEGTHTVHFDGTDDNGHTVASGMYFYRLTTDEYVASKKMILLK